MGENMDIISTKKRMCICCMEEHEVKRVRVLEHTIYKEVPIDFSAEYFYCDNADEYYMDEDMTTQNDIKVKDVYRKKMGLYTSKEIFGLREKYQISQTDLCMLLGWGGKTITRYEGHQVQDKAHDTILRKLDKDPEWFVSLLIETETYFAPELYRKYLENAIRLYEENRDNYLRKSIEASYACFHNAEMYNGNMKLSLDKVVDVIRYISNSSQVDNLYKVKLMKMLWYTDFLSYKLRGRAMMGLVYQALPMGAVPIGHDSIIDLKGVEYEEIDMGEVTAYRFKASENNIYEVLTKEDKDILDVVIQTFGHMSKNEIVSFMHKERAYKETEQRGIINYQYAEYLLI